MDLQPNATIVFEQNTFYNSSINKLSYKMFIKKKNAENVKLLLNSFSFIYCNVLKQSNKDEVFVLHI